jgi:hypothetical protein
MARSTPSKYFACMPHPGKGDPVYSAALAAIPRRGLEMLATDLAFILTSHQNEDATDFDEGLVEARARLLRCGLLTWVHDHDGGAPILAAGPASN